MHSPGCPEDPNPEPVAYQCDECGGDIFAGEDYYAVGDKHYCTECCYKCEAEMPEPYEPDPMDIWKADIERRMCNGEL